jgi:hypothetical protein
VDFQTGFNIFVAVGLPVLGWFARVIWDANKELRGDLSRLREEIPKEYVSKSDFKDYMREIKELLERIDNKLDRKADK